MLSIGQYHDICTEVVTNDCSNVAVSNIGNNCNESEPLEDLQCFVCDAKIQGRHYALATCRTQTSRSKVIEKLGELVGERYMVVISEDDVICRSCANRINTLDRLEVEMINLRDNVLRFLEQKYSLEEGELLGSNEKQKRSQPPQITKCSNQTVTSYQSKKRDIALPFDVTEKIKNKRNNIWLQCDKCQYTTLHNSFMVHHVRDHRKQKLFCDKCGIEFFGSQQDSHNCNLKEHLTEQNRNQNEQLESSMNNITQTMNIPILDKTMQQNVPIMTINTYSEPQISNHNENIPIIRLSNSENIPIQNILTSDNTASSQPIYVRVLQPVEINEAPTHSTMVGVSKSDSDLSIKQFKDSSGKQILTLTEDGNLEMTEVPCWNNMQSSESQSNMTYQ
ncbi:hypothetical protein WN55_06303 [Dufourea novaeangliae]|uniref:Uncharacterized protein n=2 Tax=Dufourea novaeangliae TaxID=178035 RepID=A0A154PPZ1_DUFNO|nr:hypothetical protein WN55_06303 [Dufourea novaeangliae]